MTALRHLAADLLEMQIHRLRVGIRQDQGRTDIAMRANSAKYVGPFAALIPRRGWTAAALGPDASQCTLLTNPGFVLPPEFNRLFARMLGDRGFDQIGKGPNFSLRPRPRPNRDPNLDAIGDNDPLSSEPAVEARG